MKKANTETSLRSISHGQSILFERVGYGIISGRARFF